MTETAEAGELAEMRRHYPNATLESHILVDGVLHLRCKRCRERPVPRAWFCAMLCDPCLDEALTP